MSSRKERIAELLSKMDNDTLDQLEDVLNTPKAEPKKQQVPQKRRRGRGKKRRQQEEEQEESLSSTRKSRQGKKRRSRSRKMTEGRSNKGQPCRVQQIDTSSKRKNKFDSFIKGASLDSSEKAELKAAEKEDKKQQGRTTFKAPRSNPIVEIKCVGCKEYFDVSSALIGNPKRYKCNACSGSACG